MKRKLKTQDKLRSWDIQSNEPLLCPLCETQPDDHNHLFFFECSFSSQVWQGVCSFAGIQVTSVDWDTIVAAIIPSAKAKTIDVIVTKLVLAASTYFIWQERNARLFKMNKRTTKQVIEVIISTVRLKLLSLKFKSNRRVAECKEIWKLPNRLV